MTEPLAATLLVGCGARVAAGRGPTTALARWLGAGAAAGGDSRWSGPSTWRSPRCWRCSCSLAHALRGRPAPRRWRGRRCCSPAWLIVVAPWTIRNAVALDRFVPISTGGGQVALRRHLPAADGDREGRRGRCSSATRTSAQLASRPPGRPERLRARADPRRAGRRALPRPGHRRRPGADGPRAALGRHHRGAGRASRASSPTRSTTLEPRAART